MSKYVLTVDELIGRKVPNEADGRWWWWRDETGPEGPDFGWDLGVSNYLPDELFFLLPGAEDRHGKSYPTKAAALSALRTAAEGLADRTDAEDHETSSDWLQRLEVGSSLAAERQGPRLVA